jgi:hypothetical protein
VSESRTIRKAFSDSKTSVDELIYICRALSEIITSENFAGSLESLPIGDIFGDGTGIRTIESWVSKIAYDQYRTKHGQDRAFRVCEVIDALIRTFAKEEEGNAALIESILKRKLTANDVVRLLWVGDQGHIFTKQFMLLFIAYLKRPDAESAILFSSILQD